MRKFNKVVAVLVAVLAVSVVMGPAVVKAAGVPGDVYNVPGSHTLIIQLTIGSKVITINGANSQIDAGPQIKGDRTWNPIAAIINALGDTITWNSKTHTATIVAHGKTIVLVIGRNYALVNGKRVYIDTDHSLAPWIQAPGRTMLPIRFIAEQLGALVQWDAKLQRVTLIFVLS
ncbi:MAG: copper amine oxidase N-terminal domain-containing protein [Candidatus Cryosericum sp.]